jgi:sugar-specific transcriptional regulator TrmB
MGSTTDDDPRDAAIERLREFGLSAYAARTFVALVVLGQGTAKDVSRDSEVPRTRVYDAVEELREWGLVDVQDSSPREFWAVSVETAGGTFQREWRQRTAVLTEALDEVEPDARRTEQRGVWTAEGSGATADRVLTFLRTAQDEVVYATVESLLDERIVTALREAADRGVTVAVGGPPAVRDRIRDEAPGVGAVPPPWGGSALPAGRVALVDGTTTLVSVFGDDANPGTETAIWGVGEANSLVVVLTALFDC